MLKLRLKICKHKIVGLFWKMSCWILTPFALIYGIIIGFYGVSKGMTRDEIMEQYCHRYVKRLRKRKGDY